MAVPTNVTTRGALEEGSPAGAYNIGATHIEVRRLTVRARWAVLLAVGAVSLLGYYGILQVSDINQSRGAFGAYVALFTILFTLYLVACYTVLSAGSSLSLTPALVLIGVVATIGRALLVPAPPTLSNDVYRYVWDGHVMEAGISPYRYPPGAPELELLRSPEYDRDLWQHINRKGAITIYPAGAEIFYAGIYRLVPDSVTAMKAAMVSIDLVSCAVLALLLGLLGMPPTRSIVYAWSPLPIIEFGSSGHVEALSVLLTLLALLEAVLAIRRYGPGVKNRLTPLSLVAALCLGGAILVKLIPALLLAGWLRRFGWRLVLIAVAVFGAASLVFVQAYGGYLSPFLGTYLKDEESNSPLYYVLRYGVSVPFSIPDGAVRLLLGGVLALCALYILARRNADPYDFLGKSFLLVAAYLFLATSAHAWYATWLLLFVPLFLPPGGLPVFGEGTPAQNDRKSKRGHRIAVASLAYTGLLFLGYLGFAFQLPAAP